MQMKLLQSVLCGPLTLLCDSGLGFVGGRGGGVLPHLLSELRLV